MTLTFAHPPHLSEVARRAKPSSSAPTPSATSSPEDPHQLPVYDSGAPVLYLPPLLSSLPKNVPAVPLSSENPPLITETHLPDIDPASLSLHKALHNFHPIDANYASTPYKNAFNWSQLTLPEDEEREWYCVVFRSKRKAGSDGGCQYLFQLVIVVLNSLFLPFEALYEADKKAHEEAVRNGGLIMYWYGIPNQETGMNLATCIWQSRKHAIAANSRPHHLKAMKLAKDSYEIYNLERYVLRKPKGDTHVEITSFDGGEVGW
ncbi:hypothetical protein E1B28_000473 [Marasmius oreades]|uniref:Uncharacterized protein n=1 Tax=Marasmius oreades TaxID=181124 RepID=A0A9P7V1J3_9AGAR|nr:uncharacterized protein E1B28_000473 [Marasmius oreades]KAG7098537.1 hypothetical protein E1B28_000473 [Marasmius oreades]